MKNKLCYVERIKREFYIVDLDKMNESLEEDDYSPYTLKEVIEDICGDEYDESCKLNIDGIEKIRTVNETKVKEG